MRYNLSGKRCGPCRGRLAQMDKRWLRNILLQGTVVQNSPYARSFSSAEELSNSIFTKMFDLEASKCWKVIKTMKSRRNRILLSKQEVHLRNKLVFLYADVQNTLLYSTTNTATNTVPVLQAKPMVEYRTLTAISQDRQGNCVTQ